MRTFTLASNVTLLPRERWVDVCTLPEGCQVDPAAQPLQVPQQPNSFDCGIYVMAFLRAMAMHVCGTATQAGRPLMEGLRLPELDLRELGSERMRLLFAREILDGRACISTLLDSSE